MLSRVMQVVVAFLAAAVLAVSIAGGANRVVSAAVSTRISAGDAHACALTDAGGFNCRGSGTFGQLGNGSKTNSAEQVDVPGLAGSIGPALIAPGLTNAWQAKVGTSGANGTVKISRFTNGAGSIALKFLKLKASSSLPVVVHKGSCGSVGAVLFNLAAIKMSSTGAGSRTNSLTAAQVRLIVAATNGTGKIAIRVGSGAATKCGAFSRLTVLGPQAVVQSFYEWYLVHSERAVRGLEASPVNLHGRADLTPAFVSWADHYNDGIMFGGADPILCAQAIPERIATGTAAISGLYATVKVSEAFGASPNVFTVSLTLGTSGWRISKGGC